MFWIFITVLLAIAFAVGWKVRFGTRSVADRQAYGQELTTREEPTFGWGVNDPGAPWVSLGVLALWLVVTVFCSINTIDAGKIGLVRTFGEFTGQQSAGLNFKAPYQSVTVVDGRILKKTIDMSGGDKGSAVSSETQPVYAKVEINYQLELAEARQLYSEVGEGYYKRIIEPRVQQAVKQETVKYKTIEIAPNREKIRVEVADQLNQQLDDYGIKVISLTIRDLDFGAKFMEAIEDKQAATEQAKAAEARVATAKAEADSVREKARGDADAIKLKGAALRANPDSLAQLSIEKLNPNVQLMVVPEDSPILQLPIPQGAAK